MDPSTSKSFSLLTHYSKLQKRVVSVPKKSIFTTLSQEKKKGHKLWLRY
jgi:hypothetical protein